MKDTIDWFGWIKGVNRLAKIVVVALLCTQGHAATVRVGAGEAIQSIREAIRVAQPGDTVLIAGGLYKEGNLRIDKPLVLLGIDMPVLDGERFQRTRAVSGAEAIEAIDRLRALAAAAR